MTHTKVRQKEENMNVQIHKDGSWDFLGENFSLLGVFPCVDGQPVKPIRVSVGKNKVTYELEKGGMELRAVDENTGISLSTRVWDMTGIHDIEPVGVGILKSLQEAQNKNVARLQVFIQGLGMEGPSGFYPVDETLRESNGLMTVYKGENSFLLYVKDHRHYINRYRIGKRQLLFGQTESFLTGGFDLEGTTAEELELPAIQIEEHLDRKIGSVLRECACSIAEFMQAGKRKTPAYHWCSWYYHYQNMSQAILENYVKEFPKYDRKLQYLQLDAGYCPSLGDWLLPNHLYPNGLKEAAETIRKSGYLPGIWIGPFMVGDQSRLYTEHPDWILRDLDGNPVSKIKSFNEPKAWGNPDGSYYVLDTSHPQAMNYLRNVFRTLKQWGFCLFKTDFMLWNMVDTSTVRRYDPSKTSVEIFRNTIHMIREEIGEESYLLGCIAPFLPFIGYADGMRIAGDVGAQWEGAYGPVNLLREIQADNYFQNVYWQNDPDSVLLRDFDIFLTPEEIESLALLQAVSGGIITTSDPLHRFSAERKELLDFIRPTKDEHTPVYPFLGEEREEIVITHSLEQGSLLYILNPTERELTRVYRIEELFGKKYRYWLRWEEACIEKDDSMILVTLKPHECALYFLADHSLKQKPQNLWNWF